MKIFYNDFFTGFNLKTGIIGKKVLNTSKKTFVS